MCRACETGKKKAIEPCTYTKGKKGKRRMMGVESLVRVGVLLVGLLVRVDNLLRDKQTPHVTHAAEVERRLALVVAHLGRRAVRQEHLHALDRTPPRGLVQRRLARLVLDARVRATRQKQLARRRVARGCSPVQRSLTQAVKLWRNAMKIVRVKMK